MNNEMIFNQDFFRKVTIDKTITFSDNELKFYNMLLKKSKENGFNNVTITKKDVYLLNL